jgi:hypothetical protein
MPQHTCPRCGMTDDKWKENDGRGVNQNGQTYCCKGCAMGTGCTCQ